jgi:hypothetical protein
MGCCSPNYRKTVNEQEEEINQKGRDQLPIFIKIIAVIIMAIGGIVAYLTS